MNEINPLTRRGVDALGAAEPTDHRALQPAAPLPEESPEPLLPAILSTLWAHKLSFTALAALVLAPLLWLITTLPDQFTARAALMIDPRERGAATMTPLVPALLGDEPAVASEMEVLRSWDLVREVVERLDLTRHPAFAERVAASPEGEEMAAVVEAVLDELDVARLNESRVIEVSYTAQRPDLAAAVAGGVAERYLERQSEQGMAIVGQAGEWLEERLEGLGAQLAEAERRAEAFRAAFIERMGSGSELIERQLDDVAAQRVAAGSALRAAEARLAVFERALADAEPQVALSLLEAPDLASLLERHAEAEQQVRALEMRYGPDHAILEEPRGSLAAIEAQMTAEVEERREAAELRVELAQATDASLGEAIAELQRRLATVREGEIEQSALDRQVEAARDVFETYLRRARDVEEVPLNQSAAWLVSAANAPTSPSGPLRPVLALAAAGFAGAFAGAMVLLRDRARRRRARDLDIARLLPSAGWTARLPRIPREIARRRTIKAIAAHLARRPNEPFARALRGAAVGMLSEVVREQRSRLVWVRAEEGEATRSFVGALAVMASHSRRHVLLVTPRTAGLLERGSEPASGLIEFLDAPVADRRPDEHVGWPVDGLPLAVMGVEEASLALLAPGTLAPALDELRTTFDLIIVDAVGDVLATMKAPPLAGVQMVLALDARTGPIAPRLREMCGGASPSVVLVNAPSTARLP